MVRRSAFCHTSSKQRVAYLTYGRGPALVVDYGWMSHRLSPQHDRNYSATQTQHFMDLTVMKDSRERVAARWGR